MFTGFFIFSGSTAIVFLLCPMAANLNYVCVFFKRKSEHK